jgi:hypothetical protein
MTEYIDYDTEPEDVEIDVEEIQRNILSVMKQLIFCDLTTGRTDNGLEPYDFEEVNEFIAENADNIEMAASSMFATFEEEDDLASLLNPCMDWFREFLYEFVTTRTEDEDEYDDGEHYGDEDPHTDDEDD